MYVCNKPDRSYHLQILLTDVCVVVYCNIVKYSVEQAKKKKKKKKKKHKQTRAPRGTDCSPEYNEHFCYKLDSRVKNLTTEWYQKQQHFITHASRSLLWIRFVAVAFRSEEKVFWRRGHPRDLFCLALDPPLSKYLYACAGPLALHPYQVL